MDKTLLGMQIRKARKDRGLTSDKLSEMIDINDTYLRQIESGLKMPSLPVFVSLCNALHVSPNYLLRGNLDVNELDACAPLSALMQSAAPSEIELVSVMLCAALERLKQLSIE